MCGTCGTGSCTGCGSFSIPEGTPGLDGWSPTFAVVADGATRNVLQLVNWTGGTGASPGHIGEYLTTTGYTATIGLATNIRGTDGASGTSGRLIAIPTYDIASNLDYVTVAGGAAYKSIAKFIFPGTAAFGTPTKVFANIWGSGGKTKDVLLYDATNAASVASATGIVSALDTNQAELNSITLAFPATQSVIEIQIRAEAAEEVRIASIMIY